MTIIETVSKMPLYIHILLSLGIIHIFVPLIVQLYNTTIAYIDEAKVAENQWHKFILKDVFKFEYISEDDVFFGYWALGLFIAVPTLAVVIYFYHITIWFVLAYGLAFTARSGRRLQKKLQAHIEDKNAHD